MKRITSVAGKLSDAERYKYDIDNCEESPDVAVQILAEALERKGYHVGEVMLSELGFNNWWATVEFPEFYVNCPINVNLEHDVDEVIAEYKWDLDHPKES